MSNGCPSSTLFSLYFCNALVSALSWSPFDCAVWHCIDPVLILGFKGGFVGMSFDAFAISKIF